MHHFLAITLLFGCKSTSSLQIKDTIGAENTYVQT